jgi:hypothetical protein
MRRTSVVAALERENENENENENECDRAERGRRGLERAVATGRRRSMQDSLERERRPSIGNVAHFVGEHVR